MAKKNYTYCTLQGLEATFNEPEGEKKASISVRVKVTACASDPSLVGTEHNEFLSLSGGAVKFTFMALRALGWTCNDVTELEGFGTIQGQGGLYTDSYQGKTREKMAIFGAKVKVTGAAKKTFAAEFKAMAVQAAKVEQTDTNKAIPFDELPTQQPALGTAGNEEEIPF